MSPTHNCSLKVLYICSESPLDSNMSWSYLFCAPPTTKTKKTLGDKTFIIINIIIIINILLLLSLSSLVCYHCRYYLNNNVIVLLLFLLLDQYWICY